MTPELTRRRFLIGAAVVGAGGLWLKFGTTPATEARVVNQGITRRNFLALALKGAGPTSGQGPATPHPEVSPTSTPRPVTEGTPTLSPEDHFSRLTRINQEIITIDGVTVNIHKTNAATRWADFTSLQLQQDYTRIIAKNATEIRNNPSTAKNAFNEVAVVFVKNKGDSPIGVFMGSFSAYNYQKKITPAGYTGYTRIGSKLIVYFALDEESETGYIPPAAFTLGNRDWMIGIIPHAYSQDGVSPQNSIRLNDEEKRVIDQGPIRVVKPN